MIKLEFPRAFCKKFLERWWLLLELTEAPENTVSKKESYFKKIIKILLLFMTLLMNPWRSKYRKKSKFCLEYFTVNVSFLARCAILILFNIRKKRLFIVEITIALT